MVESQSQGCEADRLHRNKCRVGREAPGTPVNPEEGCRGFGDG